MQYFSDSESESELAAIKTYIFPKFMEKHEEETFGVPEQVYKYWKETLPEKIMELGLNDEAAEQLKHLRITKLQAKKEWKNFRFVELDDQLLFAQHTPGAKNPKRGKSFIMTTADEEGRDHPTATWEVCIPKEGKAEITFNAHGNSYTEIARNFNKFTEDVMIDAETVHKFDYVMEFDLFDTLNDCVEFIYPSCSWCQK